MRFSLRGFWVWWALASLTGGCGDTFVLGVDLTQSSTDAASDASGTSDAGADTSPPDDDGQEASEPEEPEDELEHAETDEFP